MRETIPLNLIHKDTFYFACQRVQPDLTRELFDAMWADFLLMRDLRELRGPLN